MVLAAGWEAKARQHRKFSGWSAFLLGSSTLLVTGNVSSQRGDMLRIQGVQKGHELNDLAIPDKYVYVPPEFPRGDPFNVGQMYMLFAEAVRTYGRGVGRLVMQLCETAARAEGFKRAELVATMVTTMVVGLLDWVMAEPAKRRAVMRGRGRARAGSCVGCRWSRVRRCRSR